jgi:AcrR family transcriptional regulator
MAADLRTTRERDLVAATRRLFDERGMQDAPVEEIAQAAGIARGLIYRQFRSKEELYVLTVTTYLDELGDRLEAAAARADGDRTEALMRTFAGYCVEFPAFLDCSMSLMRRPATELQAIIGESVWLRLGAGMARCLGCVAAVLEAAGDPEPDVGANLLWTQALGAMHLARIGVTVHRGPALHRIADDAVVTACVQTARATVAARAAG